jgi:hypothetical protein
MSGWTLLGNQGTGSRFAYAFVFYVRRVFWGSHYDTKLIYSDT